jgi:hypothetical protein
MTTNYRVEVSRPHPDHGASALTWGRVPGSQTYSTEQAAMAYAEGYAAGFWNQDTPQNQARRAAFRSHCRVVIVPEERAP